MTRQRTKTRKSFTVQEANAALPLVRAIVRDLTELSREVIQRRERLSMLLAGRDRESYDPYREELLQIEDELKESASFAGMQAFYKLKRHND